MVLQHPLSRITTTTPTFPWLQCPLSHSPASTSIGSQSNAHFSTVVMPTAPQNCITPIVLWQSNIHHPMMLVQPPFHSAWNCFWQVLHCEWLVLVLWTVWQVSWVTVSCVAWQVLMLWSVCDRCWCCELCVTDVAHCVAGANPMNCDWQVLPYAVTHVWQVLHTVWHVLVLWPVFDRCCRC